jgi:sec-independent protein translocase protein TatB
MFDIGWSEMAIIMLVALIVIGPKDLPRVARTVGKWVGKGRALARDFQRQLEDMAREAELDKVKDEIEKAGRTDVKRSVERHIDPKGELKDAFKVEDSAGKRGKSEDRAAADAEASKGKSAKPTEPADGRSEARSGTNVAATPSVTDQPKPPAAPEREKVPAS